MVPGVSIKQLETIFKHYPMSSQYSKGVLQKVVLIFKTEDEKITWLITEGERIKRGTMHDWEFYGYKLHDGRRETSMVKLSTLCKGRLYFGSDVVASFPSEDKPLVSDYI